MQEIETGESVLLGPFYLVLRYQN